MSNPPGLELGACLGRWQGRSGHWGDLFFSLMSGSKGSERVASLLEGAGFTGDTGLGQQLSVHPPQAGFSWVSVASPRAREPDL